MERRAKAVLAAPIAAGPKRLGVLVVYAPRAPIFADDDLALIQLLADQAAVVLESRALIDEAARMQAREEAARLKEDFLSAAAHDLKTPLTTLVARAQLLERRALRAPDAPADLASIQLLVQEGQRLKRLVIELLDAARAEQGRLIGEQTRFDLVALAHEIGGRQRSPRHACLVEANEPVVGVYDQVRVGQLLENLIENAVKYSPAGGRIRIKIWRDAQLAWLTVSDEGIGMPAVDLPNVFDRFYRAGNVDDRRFAGMGLGLFICRGIVEAIVGTPLIANLANTVSEFADAAASMEIFGINKYISVPLAALGVWLLIIKGSYKMVERIFLVASALYLAYVASGIMANPPWHAVTLASVTPTFRFDTGFVTIVVTVIGTPIAPWMQFYQQASIVDKGLRVEDYGYERLDVIIGSVFAVVVAAFITIACAATLLTHGLRIETAKDAALALVSLAGPYAAILFALGLLNASRFSAAILPLSTAYVVCEALGWESGVSRTWKEAPVFFGVYTALIVLGNA